MSGTRCRDCGRLFEARPDDFVYGRLCPPCVDADLDGMPR